MLANFKAAVCIVARYRELAHLLDVQASTLARAQTIPETNSRNHNRNNDELGPEEDAEQQELRGTFVYKHLESGLDTL